MTTEQKKELIAECEQAIEKGVSLSRRITFYSPGCPGLTITAYMGRLGKGPKGEDKLIDQQIVQFSLIASTKEYNSEGKPIVRQIGGYATDHPHAVLGLLKRMDEKGDICDEEKFQEIIIPTDEKLRIERHRTIETANRLEEYLQREKLQAAVLAAKEEELENLRKQLSVASVGKAGQKPVQANG